MPLSAYTDSDTVAPASSPQPSETKSPVGASTTAASIWKRHIARWPHAFVFSSVVLVLTVYLYNRLIAEPGMFDWHLYLWNAGLSLGVLLAVLMALKALRDARKAAPLRRRLPQVFVGTLLGVLYLSTLLGILLPVNLLMAYKSYSSKQAFYQVAPTQFRASIIQNEPVPVLREDALVIRDVIQWFSSHSYGHEMFLMQQLNRDISPPLSELLMTMILYDHYPSPELEREMSDGIYGLAQMYGFQSWEELQYFVATQSVSTTAP